MPPIQEIEVVFPGVDILLEVEVEVDEPLFAGLGRAAEEGQRDREFRDGGFAGLGGSPFSRRTSFPRSAGSGTGTASSRNRV